MNQFYLRDTRYDCGSTCMLWNKDGKGYGSDLDKLELFDFDQAQKYADEIKDGRHFVPISKFQVDSVSTMRVDMQCLHYNEALHNDFRDGYVINVRAGDYDGNDIYFIGQNGSTPNYNEAIVFNSPDEEIASKGVVYSKSHMDSIARRTIQADSINMRKMVTNYGIRYRSPVKRYTTGQERGNCPTCGKITWGYDPHENEYCDRWCRP